MTQPLVSRSNPLVRRMRALASEASARRDEGAYLAEGVRLVEEALAAGADIERVLVSPRLSVTDRGRQLRAALAARRITIVEASDEVAEAVSDAQSSQGIVAIVRGAPSDQPLVATAGSSAFWVIAWGLQDPGNAGTLIRTAHAAGADRFLSVAGTTDPISPKAVRASAGSVFHLPITHGLAADDILNAARGARIRLFGTDPVRGVPYDEAAYRGPIGFVFGREGEGLPPAVAERLDAIVTIPMQRGVESLNVAAAAAVVLFEAARQRRVDGASA